MHNYFLAKPFDHIKWLPVRWFGQLIGEGEFQNSGGRRKPKLRLKYNLKKNQRKVVN